MSYSNRQIVIFDIIPKRAIREGCIDNTVKIIQGKGNE